jgi:hypothetical protein
MIELSLYHHLPGESLSFTWDSDTGELSGPDSHRVQRLLALADGKATLPGGWPEMDAPDPLHTPASFALIMAGYGYELPPELAAALPEMVDDTPEDAVA